MAYRNLGHLGVQVMKEMLWVEATWCSTGNVTWHLFFQTVDPADIFSLRFHLQRMYTIVTSTSPCKLQHSIFADLWWTYGFQFRWLALILGMFFSFSISPIPTLPETSLQSNDCMLPMAACKDLSMAVFVMGFKGDWKYLCQLFNLVRTPTSEQARWSNGGG